MKYIFIISSALLSNLAIAQYITKQEVLKEFNKLSKQENIKEESLNDEAINRKNNLIPLNLFFDKKGMQELKIFIPPPIKANEIAQEVDLRARDTSIKNQGNYGYCTAFSGVAIMENIINRNGNKPGLDLSDWHAWSKYQQYSCYAFINAITKNFICDEKYFPQSGKEQPACAKSAYAKIRSQEFIENNVTAMKSALTRGNPVYIAMTTPNSMLKCDKVINPNTTPSDGGHALAVMGYYTQGNETIAILKNSWGNACGDKGYQYFPMSICKKNGFYCQMWEISEVEISSNPTPIPTVIPTAIPKPIPVCTKWKRIWWKPWIKVCTNWQ